MSPRHHIAQAALQAAAELLEIPPGRRGGVTRQALIFTPPADLDRELPIGVIRALLADARHELFGTVIPLVGLRRSIESRHIRVEIVLGRLNLPRTPDSLTAAIATLLEELEQFIALNAAEQR